MILPAGFPPAMFDCHVLFCLSPAVWVREGEGSPDLGQLQKVTRELIYGPQSVFFVS